ncbi:MAG: hypothetical protein HXN48_02795 [Prevotella nanceiensis]|jgi:hypothetical protein|uniref:Uncharacterized protein n=1 Tax=Hoylesella nanceiensis TaxID=425941 RepID=A0ABS6YCN3_9BACT|nr:hypothetical protein [Hoylesella nanceiensis]MBF1437355.1 hypothetical protein [Hoylesella nanceiensis]MBW4769027.1 hypothetical protein [Hoylesella nanceiensis]
MEKLNQSDLLRAMILTKNAYVQPCCSALNLEFEHHITAGSNKRIGGNAGHTGNTGTEWQEEDDDN